MEMPITSEIAATVSETRPPYMIRVSTSRPRWSAPSMYRASSLGLSAYHSVYQNGGAPLPRRFISSSPNGATHGASMVMPTSKTTMAMGRSGQRRNTWKNRPRKSSWTVLTCADMTSEVDAVVGANSVAIWYRRSVVSDARVNDHVHDIG